MSLAKRSRLQVPEFGLIRMDQGLAYITKRFDRTKDGRKLHQEDFCQLEELSPANKYDGSGERCAKVVKRFVSEPAIQTLRLFEQLVFCWWVGNGDLHLKNLSLMVDPAGIVKLTPCYDLVSTQLVIQDDPLALPICGKAKNLNHSTWLKFAEYFQIPIKAAERVLKRQAECLPSAHALIDSSFLPEEMKHQLKELTQERSRILIAPK